MRRLYPAPSDAALTRICVIIDIRQKRLEISRPMVSNCPRLYKSISTDSFVVGELPEHAKINETDTFGDAGDGDIGFEFDEDRDGEGDGEGKKDALDVDDI